MSNTSDVIQAWAAQIKKQGADIAANAHRELVIILIVSVLLALSMPILANINMFSALANLRNAARALAQEEYDAKIPYTHRQDEIGTLARTLEALRLKAVDAFRLKKMIDDMPLNVITADARDEFKINYANNATKKTLQLLQQHLPVAVADIEGKSIDIFHKDPGRIRRLLADPANLPHEAKIKIGEDIIDQKISAMFDKKGEYVGPMLTWEIVTKNIKLADDFESSVGAVSQQIAASAGTLQQRAATLESAIEELSAAALEISKRVHEALRIVQDAVSQGDSAAGHTTELSTSADKVTGVITLIRSIAEKTNLLALNATIESARAGEAGKGFAVVANEVKSLASQTATAITDITSQINEMQHSAAGTADAIKQMCAIITNVNKIATEIASTVEEQQAATAEIARNISGSSKGISSSTTMMGMATQLTEVSTDLSNRCDSFLEKVRKI